MSAYMGTIDYQDLLNMQDDAILHGLEVEELESLLGAECEWPTAEEYYEEDV